MTGAGNANGRVAPAPQDLSLKWAVPPEHNSGVIDAPMPIVVFWIETAGVPAHREFGGAELLQALKLTEQLRAQGKQHVTISSDLDNSVGAPGVDEVSGGRLPGGEPYEFNKRQRGGGPKA